MAASRVQETPAPEAKIRALQTRHAELKEHIRKEQHHPAVTAEALHELKAEKLRLKDEIYQIETSH